MIQVGVGGVFKEGHGPYPLLFGQRLEGKEVSVKSRSVVPIPSSLANVLRAKRCLSNPCPVVMTISNNHMTLNSRVGT